MLLHTVYTVTVPANETLGLELPFTLSLDADTQASLVEHESGMQLLLDRRIDTTKLEMVKDSGSYKNLADGTHEPVPALRLVEDDTSNYILGQDFVSVLTFLTDVVITLSPSSVKRG